MQPIASMCCMLLYIYYFELAEHLEFVSPLNRFYIFQIIFDTPLFNKIIEQVARLTDYPLYQYCIICSECTFN